MALAPWLIAARVTACLALRGCPTGIGHEVQKLLRRIGVVTHDDQFAWSRAFFSRLVADEDIEAGTRMQGCWEWIVDQFPVLAIALQRDVSNVELAVSDIADRDRTLSKTPALHSPDTCRACHHKLA